jgi:hypothetical protein
MQVVSMELVESKVEPVGGRKSGESVIRGWLVVSGVALLFVAYGLLLYFAIGDKGPPDWDFGSVEDVPGASVYSTYPYGGPVSAPDRQHVSQRPPKAEIGLSEPVGRLPGKSPN